MQSTLTRLTPTQVELEIPLAANEVDAARQRAFARLARNVRLPGFRRGKVPRLLFEQTYGTAGIESEALDDVAPLAYERALGEHALDPVGQPTIEVLMPEEGKPVRLKATVEVCPHIELGEYKGISVEVPSTVVTDEDVERSLESLVRERATLVPVDRQARLGDVVTIDYEGRIDGRVFDGGSATAQETELAQDGFIPGFATGIAGMLPGETRTVSATFPPDYGRVEYAGKDAAFTVTLHEVKEIELPEPDDQFAKSVSECESIETLRSEIRKRLEAVATARRRRAIGNAVMERLLARLDIGIPQGLRDREAEIVFAQAEQSAERAGIGFDAYLERIGKTREQFSAQCAQEATSRVKGTLAIGAIAKAEQIEATAGDVREEIEALARQYGQPPERIRKALGRKVDSLKEGIVRNKTLELLIDHAKVHDSRTGREATAAGPS